MRMRMSRYDRLMAIKRHPEFEREYRKYKEYKNSQGQRALKKLIEIETRWGEHLGEIVNAENFKDATNSVQVVTYIRRKPIRAIYTGDEITEIPGERLYVEIDLNDTNENILKGVERIIRRYKKALPDNKNRNKQPTRSDIDLWEVYDLKTGGLSLSEIAQQNSGIKSKKFDNPHFKACYDAVQRAYVKAEGYINTLT